MTADRYIKFDPKNQDQFFIDIFQSQGITVHDLFYSKVNEILILAKVTYQDKTGWFCDGLDQFSCYPLESHLMESLNHQDNHDEFYQRCINEGIPEDIIESFLFSFFYYCDNCIKNINGESYHCVDCSKITGNSVDFCQRCRHLDKTSLNVDTHQSSHQFEVKLSQKRPRIESWSKILFSLMTSHHEYPGLDDFLIKQNQIEFPTDQTLYQAVKNNDLSKVQELLDHQDSVINQFYSLNPNNPLSDQETLLHLAIKKSKDKEIIRLLVQKGCDLNQCSLYGTRPINYAIHNFDLEMIKLLIELGIDLNSSEDPPSLNYNSFCHNTSFYLLKSLLPLNQIINSKTIVEEDDQVQIMKLLLDGGISADGLEDQRPLSHAVDCHQTKVMNLLLEYQATPCVEALRIALFMDGDNLYFIQKLLEAGANPDEPVDNGLYTPRSFVIAKLQSEKEKYQPILDLMNNIRLHA